MSKGPQPKTAQAKVQVKRKLPGRKIRISEADLPQSINFLIIVAGVVVIILGYLVMWAGDVESPLAVTYGPIILVIGYCVVIPVGILYRRKVKPSSEPTAS